MFELRQSGCGAHVRSHCVPTERIIPVLGHCGLSCRKHHSMWHSPPASAFLPFCFPSTWDKQQACMSVSHSLPPNSIFLGNSYLENIDGAVRKPGNIQAQHNLSPKKRDRSPKKITTPCSKHIRSSHLTTEKLKFPDLFQNPRLHSGFLTGSYFTAIGP